MVGSTNGAHREARNAVFLSILIGLFLLILPACSKAGAEVQPNLSQPSLPKIECYFSPNGNCTKTIINEIKSAKETIFVQAYYFTSEPIAQALIDAYKRGIKVEVILDESQRKRKDSKAGIVAQAGISTLIDSKHAIAHNKIIIIDSKTLITGSFNFTKNAEEKNTENLLIIKDQPELVRKYTDNYLKHKEHSEEY